MKPTIIFTGGHYNSSLVIAKALKKQGYSIAWVGQKFTSSRDKSLSAEYQEVTSNNIPFYPIKTGKFYKKYSPFEYIQIILGFLQSLLILLRIRPALIVSFGGYISVPMVIVGWVLGIVSITHEQTVTAGWANKANSLFVKKIMVAHPSSVKNYPSEKTVIVGLPLEEELLAQKITKEFEPPLLFITCGKTGSHIINQVVFPLIPDLVQKYTVVHQTGSNGITKDVDRARRIHDSLGELKSRYITAPHFFGKDFSLYTVSAQIIISRSGAHTAYKHALLKKRSIFIPIPWVSHNEQMLNAKLTAQLAPTIILEEKNLSSESLLDSIEAVQKLKLGKVTNTLPTDATDKILQVIHQYV